MRVHDLPAWWIAGLLLRDLEQTPDDRVVPVLIAAAQAQGRHPAGGQTRQNRCAHGPIGCSLAGASRFQRMQPVRNDSSKTRNWLAEMNAMQCRRMPDPESAWVNRLQRSVKMTDDGRQKLDEALDRLQQDTPDRVCRAIRWLRNPQARWIRLPIGLACIASGFFWYLPVVGVEFIPLGLLLIAIDVPFLRKPVAAFTIWLEDKWEALRDWWHRKRQP